MTLYRKAHDKLEAVPRTTFEAEKLLERGDLQRLLRADLSPLGVELLLLAEEYSQWAHSSRRIDLLCLRGDGHLVVVEIKRTVDDGHMELQALRYASMVSLMTFHEAVAAYAQTHCVSAESAAGVVRDFLGTDFVEAEWTADVAIILVSADFSTEITTSVLWLNTRNLDITCIRLRPYRLGSDILLDATQIIPLPEAKDYAVRIRQQEVERRENAGVRDQQLQKFFTQLIAVSVGRTPLIAKRRAPSGHWISIGTGRGGISLYISVKQQSTRLECYISLPAGEQANTAAFTALLSERTAIDAVFGAPLNWRDLTERLGCRIWVDVDGGWTAPEAEWPSIHDTVIDTLIRLDAALRPAIQKLPS